MKRLVAIALAMLVPVVSAGAQVVPTQTGRELDANYGLGTRGFNSFRGTERYYGPQSAANLLITGQTTRGSFFRGPVPYTGANQLRLSLPSDTIADFNRDTFGIADVAAQPGYAPQPYFAPSRTVLGVRSIELGLNAPGSSAPAQPTVTPELLAAERRIEARVDQAPLLSVPMVGGIRMDIPLEEAGPARPVFVRGGPEERPQVSTLFGVLSPAESERLARLLLAPDLAPDQAEARLPGVTDLDSRLTGELPPLTPPGAQPWTGELPGLAPTRVEPPPAGPEPPPRLPEDAQGRRPDQWQRGQDVFTDIRAELDPQPDPAGQARGAYGRRPELLAPGAVGPAARPPVQIETPTDGNPQVVEPTREQIVLHSLAGRQPDQFNRYLETGDQQLRQGQFYDAAQTYRTAQLLRRDNPLPLLGASLAYLGAGEPLTSSYYLLHAMRLYPPLMRARVDLPALIGDEAARTRIEQLERRLGSDEIADQAAQADLTLLAAYLHHSLGRPDQARRWARRLQEMATERQTVHRAFAAAILTDDAPQRPPAEDLRTLPPGD